MSIIFEVRQIKEYFERKRLDASSSVKVNRDKNNPKTISKRKRHHVSQDVLSFKRQSRADSSHGNDSRSQNNYRVVNLDSRQMPALQKGVNETGSKQVEHVELPLSPIETPSVLQLYSPVSAKKSEERQEPPLEHTSAANRASAAATLALHRSKAKMQTAPVVAPSSHINLFGLPVARPVKSQTAICSANVPSHAYAINSTRCSREHPNFAERQDRMPEFIDSDILDSNSKLLSREESRCSKNVCVPEDFQVTPCCSYDKFQILNSGFKIPLDPQPSRELGSFSQTATADKHDVGFIELSQYSGHGFEQGSTKQHDMTSFHDISRLSSSPFRESSFVSARDTDSFSVNVVNSPEYRLRKIRSAAVAAELDRQSQSSYTSETSRFTPVPITGIDDFRVPSGISEYSSIGKQVNICEDIGRQACDIPGGQKRFTEFCDVTESPNMVISSIHYPHKAVFSPYSAMYAKNNKKFERDDIERYGYCERNDVMPNGREEYFGEFRHKARDTNDVANGVCRSDTHILSHGLDQTPDGSLKCMDSMKNYGKETLQWSQGSKDAHGNVRPRVSGPTASDAGNPADEVYLSRCLAGVAANTEHFPTKHKLHISSNAQGCSPFPGDICPQDRHSTTSAVFEMRMIGQRVDADRMPAPIMASTPRDQTVQMKDIPLSAPRHNLDYRHTKMVSEKDLLLEMNILEKQSQDKVDTAPGQCVTSPHLISQAKLQRCIPTVTTLEFEDRGTGQSYKPQTRVSTSALSVSRTTDNSYKLDQKGSSSDTLAQSPQQSEGKRMIRQEHDRHGDNSAVYNMPTSNQPCEDNSSSKVRYEKTLRTNQRDENSSTTSSMNGTEYTDNPNDGLTNVCHGVIEKSNINTCIDNPGGYKISVGTQTTPKQVQDVSCSPIKVFSFMEESCRLRSGAGTANTGGPKTYSLRSRSRVD